MIRVVTIAPTTALRAGLRALLVGDDLEVVAEAASFAGYAAQLEEIDVLVAAGDLALEEAARAISGDSAPAIVVLSDDERAAAILRALPARGWGIVSPDAAATEMRAAVQAAAQGLVVLPLALSARLLNQRPPADTPTEPLTARESEVLELLSQGLSNKLIARQLQISEHTVKFHVASLFAKLGASSRTDAVSRGARRGLIIL